MMFTYYATHTSHAHWVFMVFGGIALYGVWQYYEDAAFILTQMALTRFNRQLITKVAPNVTPKSYADDLVDSYQQE